MKVRRGDIVLIDHPFSDASGAKVRPVLVVQNDADNARITNTVVVTVTKNLSRVGRVATQVLVDISTPEGQPSGLTVTSAVTCSNPFTVHESRIIKRLGYLPAVLMRQVDHCLKVVLDLP